MIRNGIREAGFLLRVLRSRSAVQLPEVNRVPAGMWFVLADNRRESDDSRFFGPVPRSWIIGVAIMRTSPLRSVGFLAVVRQCRHRQIGGVSEDQDWRLKAVLDAEDRSSTLDHLLGRVRGPDVVEEVGEEVSHDVAITHDGNLLFAYAASRASLTTGRRAIEAVLRRDGVRADVYVSHWDERFDGRKLQVEPPLTGEAKRTEEAASATPRRSNRARWSRAPAS